jgi:hypothetical protein
MSPNLRLYHKVMEQVRKWLPTERVTRQRNMALLISGLFFSMAIHLSHIVSEWPLPGKEVSLVNRLRRFLNNPRLDVRTWYRPVAEQIIAALAHTQMRLIIDCTKLGFNHRLLTISVAYRKRALPLIWSVHAGSKGHVSSSAQIALFSALAPLIPPTSRVWVLGDSGFQNVPLLHWLARRGWQFVIRQQGRICVRTRTGDWRKLNSFALQPGQTRTIGWVRLTQKHDLGWLWLLLHWAAGESEPWYLVSTCANTSTLLRHYRVRMWTEEFYGDLKGHGFDLEATHLQDTVRLERLVLAVWITFVWFITLGAWLVKRGLRHLIDRKDRRDKSYFRLGWDWLRRAKRLNLPFRLHFVPYP